MLMAVIAMAWFIVALVLTAIIVGMPYGYRR